MGQHGQKGRPGDLGGTESSQQERGMTRFSFQEEVLESGWRAIQAHWGSVQPKVSSPPSAGLFAEAHTCAKG